MRKTRFEQVMDRARHHNQRSLAIAMEKSDPMHRADAGPSLETQRKHAQIYELTKRGLPIAHLMKTPVSPDVMANGGPVIVGGQPLGGGPVLERERPVAKLPKGGQSNKNKLAGKVVEPGPIETGTSPDGTSFDAAGYGFQPGSGDLPL